MIHSLGDMVMLVKFEEVRTTIVRKNARFLSPSPRHISSRQI